MNGHAIKRSLLAALAGFFLLLGAPAAMQAQGGIVNNGPGDSDPSAPEIDPSMVGGGLALLGGVTLILRSKRGR